MQAQDPEAPRCEAYRFGTFEVSIRQRMLRQRGERLKIQELPFQMLLVLLESPGEIVSKEELGKRLWGEETFIEVDKSLYVMAGKLREALGDNANQPLFIKTVSGRGYRFIGEVTPVFLPVENQPAPSPPPTAREVEFSQQPPAAWRRAAWSLPLLAILALVLPVYRYLSQPLASDQDRVVVGGFTNGTGNPDLDGTLSSAVQLKLQESPYLSLIPDQKFKSAVKTPDSAGLQEELHACSSLNGQILLKGRINAKPSGYEVLLTAWRCSNGRSLTTQKAEATSQATILPALDLATEQMRRRLGEPQSSLQRFNVPLIQATTASLAALKAFTLGEAKRSDGDSPDAIASYKLAVDLDPQFALAYARLGTLYYNSGEYKLSRQYYQKAYELRDRSTDREKLYIVTHYYHYVTGEIKRTIDDYELWRTLYPRDIVPDNNLAIEYLTIGQPEKALPLIRRAIQLDPTNPVLYENLNEIHLKLGDFAQVNQLCSDPIHGEGNIMGFHRVCFRAAFHQGDEAGMKRQLDWARGNPEEAKEVADDAWVNMYRGKVADAARLFAAARQSAVSNGSMETVADVQLDKASLEADYGLSSLARRDAREVLHLPFETAAEQAYASRALARAGDKELAELAARRSASLAPLDTIVNSAMLASVRAAIHLQQHLPQRALQDLEESRPLDLCSYMELAPAYYRGLAYLQNKQPKEAAAEFQKVIDHRLLADFPVYVVLSQMELGHALQLLGDRTNAERSYRASERVWSEADPDFPPLQELRAYERQLHGDGAPQQTSSNIQLPHKEAQIGRRSPLRLRVSNPAAAE
jgi:DNA-binding winged helix-turn-helix (wHTH) protein/tetratricopeptide (TPR) repeat protein